MSIDLHIHSIYSDGTQTPDEIVRIAVRKGLQAIAITDHDTMAGTREALEAGRRAGLEVVPGLELSAFLNETYLHILGYGMDFNDPALAQGLSRLQIARDERNLKIVNKIRELGFDISMEDVKRLSHIGQTGRPHIARILVARGAVRNMTDAFEKFLKKGAPAYFSRFVYTAMEAIRIIKQAGGLAVLAHPVQIDPSFKNFSDLMDELVALGLDGVELYYPTQSAGVRKKIRCVTDRYQLLYTGGSDYHGDIRPGSHLGGGKNARVPLDVMDRLRERLSSIKNMDEKSIK